MQESRSGKFKYDAVIVNGGGVEEVNSKVTVYPWVKNRFERAVEIPSQYLIALSGGTTNKPPILQNGYPIPESVAGLNYAISLGLDESKILIPETTSLDTIGNFYHLRTQITDPLELTKIAIVSSAFQMGRVIASANWIYKLTPVNKDYKIDFFAVPDQGMDYETRRARVLKEHESLNTLRQKRQELTTMKDFALWLFTEHLAYSLKGWNNRVPLTDTVSNSY